MTATNHDDRLGEIYPTMLKEFKCTFSVSFHGFNCCGRHGTGPLWTCATWFLSCQCRRDITGWSDGVGSL